MSQRIVALVALVLLLSQAGASGMPPNPSPPSGSATSFYNAPPNLDDAMPGDLLRTEPVDVPSPGVRLWRILYVSTDIDDRPVAVSGLLAIPAAESPPEGFPLLTVGHGTVGVAPQCAPSIDPGHATPGSQDSYALLVHPLVTAGYAVVMSDYQGLGVNGASSFLVGALEGRNLLDAARAAFAFPDASLQPGVLIWGHSQGGHAALFAAYIAPEYAPDLDIRGAVAAAPVTDLEVMFTTLIQSDAPGGILSLALMTADAWAHAYPDVELRQLLTVRGQATLATIVRSFCLTPAFLATQFDRPPDLILPATLNRLAPYMMANTPPNAPYDLPILIIQGREDPVVPESITARVAAAMCAAGTELTYLTYPADHLRVIDMAQPDVIAWMDAALSGMDPPDRCDPAGKAPTPVPIGQQSTNETEDQ